MTATTIEDPKQLVAEWRGRLAAGEDIPVEELAQALSLIRRSRLVPTAKAPKASKAAPVRSAEELKDLFTQRI